LGIGELQRAQSRSIRAATIRRHRKPRRLHWFRVLRSVSMKTREYDDPVIQISFPHADTRITVLGISNVIAIRTRLSITAVRPCYHGIVIVRIVLPRQKKKWRRDARKRNAERLFVPYEFGTCGAKAHEIRRRRLFRQP